MAASKDKNKDKVRGDDAAHKKSATDAAEKKGTHHLAPKESIITMRGKVVGPYEMVTEMDFRRSYEEPSVGEARLQVHADKGRLVKGNPPKAKDPKAKSKK